MEEKGLGKKGSLASSFNLIRVKLLLFKCIRVFILAWSPYRILIFSNQPIFIESTQLLGTFFWSIRASTENAKLALWFIVIFKSLLSQITKKFSKRREQQKRFGKLYPREAKSDRIRVHKEGYHDRAERFKKEQLSFIFL